MSKDNLNNKGNQRKQEGGPGGGPPHGHGVPIEKAKDFKN